MVEVVAALIWDNDKFMICQRPAHKARGLLWEFVGGKVEPGESKEQALIRECQEELAITLTVGEVFMDVVHEYPDINVHLTLFNATIAEGVPQKLELKLKNNLKEARTQKKLSQTQLAEMVGVSRNTISSIETGQFNPTAKLALILCIALDKKFEELFYF